MLMFIWTWRWWVLSNFSKFHLVIAVSNVNVKIFQPPSPRYIELYKNFSRATTFQQYKNIWQSKTEGHWGSEIKRIYSERCIKNLCSHPELWYFMSILKIAKSAKPSDHDTLKSFSVPSWENHPTKYPEKWNLVNSFLGRIST